MNEINLYDVECLTNFENIYNFEKFWSGVFILDRNNFFYGIGKTNIGYKFLMIGVYLPEKGIKFRTFQPNKNYITEYMQIEGSYGTICTLSRNSEVSLIDCKFNIKENNNLNIKCIKQKINQNIEKIKENKFQNYMFLESLSNYSKVIEEINHCYNKSKYLIL